MRRGAVLLSGLILVVFLVKNTLGKLFSVSLSSDIQHALLYSSHQAQITRSIPITEESRALSAGHHEVRIVELTCSLNDQSLRLSVSLPPSVPPTGVQILDFSLSSRSIPRRESSEYLAAYAKLEQERDEVDLLLLDNAFSVTRSEARLAAFRLHLEKTLSPSTSSSSSSSPSLSLAEAGKVIADVDGELLAVQKTLVSLRRDKRRLEKERERLSAELNALSIDSPSQPRVVEEKALSVHLYLPRDLSLPESETLFSLSLEYLVSPAVWSPAYDVRLRPAQATASSSVSPYRLEIDQYALVSQHTGEDWRNVTLTLSTSSPSFFPPLPVPPSRSVSVAQQRLYGGAFASQSAPLHKRSRNMGNGNFVLTSGVVDMQDAGGAESVVPAVEMMEFAAQVDSTNALSAVSLYKIAHPVNVSHSDSHAHTQSAHREKQRLLLTSHALDAALYTFVVPSQQRAAWLVSLAQLPPQSVALLASDDVRVEIDDSLAGTTSLPSLLAGDFFSLPMGENRFVRVSSQEIVPAQSNKEEDKSTWFVQDKKKFRVRTHERTVSIHTAYPSAEQAKSKTGEDSDEVTIVVSENLPRSTDADIRVELVSPSQASLLRKVRDGSESDDQLTNEEFLSFLLRKELLSSRETQKKNAREMRVYHCKTSGNLFWVLRMKKDNDDMSFSFKFQVVSPEEKPAEVL